MSPICLRRQTKAHIFMKCSYIMKTFRGHFKTETASISAHKPCARQEPPARWSQRLLRHLSPLEANFWGFWPFAVASRRRMLSFSVMLSAFKSCCCCFREGGKWTWHTIDRLTYDFLGTCCKHHPHPTNFGLCPTELITITNLPHLQSFLFDV